MLSERQLEDVCLRYQGARQCRYLDGDPENYDRFLCKKRSTYKKVIDEMSEEYIQDCRKNGVDPMTGDQSIGDNCSGYVLFKDLLQGYDVEGS